MMKQELIVLTVMGRVGAGLVTVGGFQSVLENR